MGYLWYHNGSAFMTTTKRVNDQMHQADRSPPASEVEGGLTALPQGYTDTKGWRRKKPQNTPKPAVLSCAHNWIKATNSGA